jgi:hypothetical protein
MYVSAYRKVHRALPYRDGIRSILHGSRGSKVIRALKPAEGFPPAREEPRPGKTWLFGEGVRPGGRRTAKEGALRGPRLPWPYGEPGLCCARGKLTDRRRAFGPG